LSGLTVEADLSTQDERWMREALALAGQAAALGEVPVGAVIVTGEGELVGSGQNRRELDRDPTAHAEMEAIREAAAKLAAWRLAGCTLYVTLEPCAMCAGAAVLARLQRVVFGASDPKGGFCGSPESLGDLVRHPRLNHRLDVRGGVLGEESSALLKRFFAGLRG
jgi:tRNA(adenine34) deaminase